MLEAYAWDGEQLVGGYAPEDKVARWEATWGPGLDRLVELRTMVGSSTQEFLPVVDARVSVVGLMAYATRRTPQVISYSPEGAVVVRDGNDAVVCDEAQSGVPCALPEASPFGFNSAWRSGTTGLVYMRNRWYSPELGEFLSHDPLGAVDSFSLYAFAAFDPINGWDPFGLKNTCLTPDCGALRGINIKSTGSGGGGERVLKLGGLRGVNPTGAPGGSTVAPPGTIPVCTEQCQADQLAEALEKSPAARDKILLEGVTVEQALKEGLIKETDQPGTPDPAQADAFAKEASKPGGFLDREADALNAAGFYDASKAMAAGAAGIGLRASVRTVRPLTAADLGVGEKAIVEALSAFTAGRRRLSSDI